MKLEPIDTSTTAGKARVMQLAAEGRRLAFADEGVVPDDEIEEVALLDVDWNWSKFQYFIIAQPVGPDEVWVSLDSNGNPILAYGSEAETERAQRMGNSVVRYRRVEE